MKVLITFLFLVSSLSTLAVEKLSDLQKFYPYYAQSKAGQETKVINSGIAALELRLRMIERAKESIELEYFIFNANRAVRLIMQALEKKAREGVKVRILIDKSAAVFSFDEFYARFFKTKNIEVRYYNPAPLIAISSVQFRNHRKLLSIDNKEVLTGGRNLDDDYFDLSDHYNFHDRDIWIKGDIVPAIVDSFNKYWDAEITERPKAPKIPRLFHRHNKHQRRMEKQRYIRRVKKYNKNMKTAINVIDITADDIELREKVRQLGGKILDNSPIRVCKNMTFATDRPGGKFKTRLDSDNYKDTFKILRQEIGYRITKNVDEKIFIDSPYLLLNKSSKRILTELLEQKKKVSAYTNSLSSTDAIYIASVFNPEVKKWTKREGFNVYLHRGDYFEEVEEEETIDPSVKEAVWGTHSKTIVIDDDEIMIGTYNIDNRSDFYNSELAVFCDGNKELAGDVLDNLDLRIKAGVRLNKEGLPEDGSDLLGDSSKFKRLIYHLLKGPAAILKFLL